MVRCCLEEGPHLLALFCSQSRVKTKWGPCPTATLVSTLPCAGAAGITQKHPFPQLPSSHHFPGVADSGFLGREGGWKRRWNSLQKRPFPRIRPSLSATCYIPRAVLRASLQEDSSPFPSTGAEWCPGHSARRDLFTRSQE